MKAKASDDEKRCGPRPEQAKLCGLRDLDPVEACVLRVHVSVRATGSNLVEARAGGFCLATDWFVSRQGSASWARARSREPRALQAAAPTGHLLEALAGDAMSDLSAAMESAGLLPIKMEAASEIGSGNQGLRATLYALAEVPVEVEPMERLERAELTVSRFLNPVAGLTSEKDARWVGASMEELNHAREALEAIRLARIEAWEIQSVSGSPEKERGGGGGEGRRL